MPTTKFIQPKMMPNNDTGYPPPMPKKDNWVPMEGVSLDNQTNGSPRNKEVKIRGTGAAIKGIIARGPMA